MISLWGKKNKNDFSLKKLITAARKCLSSLPVTVEGKQMLSSAGQVYLNGRCNLLGENPEKLLFLAYNILIVCIN